MAKKSDILLTVYEDFKDYSKTYNSRLQELEREFLHANRDTAAYLQEINDQYAEREKLLEEEFLRIERTHFERVKEISHEYDDRFDLLETDITGHNLTTVERYEAEDDTYNEILSQFEERKAEAFKNYLNLTKETNYQIDREMRVHSDFIQSENEKLQSKQIEYQELNSNLSNQLLWTMEKAKNALSKLNTSLIEEGSSNREYLSDVISESIENLNDSKTAMGELFKSTSRKFEKEREMVRTISQEKRKPHSDLNLQMIHTFIEQIREVNQNKTKFEAMINRELDLSLSQLYPKIIEADTNQQVDELRKLILQKEIIEKKVDYLRNRNQSMADLLISKYQNEIKKIKIDSFRRSEEIKLAYSVPVAFFQNSITVYSNFAFYLNETYEELSNMLTQFKEFNRQYIDYRADYIHTSQKTFEDYKINLLVKVNDLTTQLTEYITQIDQTSNEIITLESSNRLEIAEIKKKMENIEVFGDYQKYLASLENDQYIAMFQHNKNIEQIQIESNYTNNLFSINKEVLLLNQNKLEYQEFKEYMLRIAEHEQVIHELAHQKKKDETKALYQQKIDQVLALSKLAHERIVYNAKRQNFEHASSYVRYLEDSQAKQEIGSKHIIEYIGHAQALIDLNIEQTKTIQDYISKTTDDHAYLRALESNREDLLKTIDRSTDKKNQICYTAISLYEQEINDANSNLDHVFERYFTLLKNDLLKLENLEDDVMSLLKHLGYRHELSAVIDHVYMIQKRLAYKYQNPALIKRLESESVAFMEEFLVRSLRTFKNVERQKPTPIKHQKNYLIETISMFESMQTKAKLNLDRILEHASANDREFIAATIKKSDKNKTIINKEYDKLQYTAYRFGTHKNKQLHHLQNRSEQINQIYKTQVKTINKEFLDGVAESEKIAEFIAKKYVRIIKKNDKELKQMLSFLEKLFKNERKSLDKQFDQFQKALETIEITDQDAHKQELIHIQTLYDNRDLEASKTINLLETKINTLPVEKNKYYYQVQKDKHALVAQKRRDLQHRLAEIERDKFVSRPNYLEEIETVKKRLPEDYIALYNQIQHLEFNYLNQFGKINEEYTQNYRDYLLNQSGNNEILERGSSLYMPFEKIQQFHEKIIKTSTSTYRDAIAKSKKTREELNKETQKSNERQKRIINT
ncbi:MAG: hypothetical protein JXB08_05510 [Bacilli bacterium]|nr:hypothetical protein [Bacilli bacterium]MBN2877510.1 hypothetical protein [Bacilli bacterium]